MKDTETNYKRRLLLGFVNHYSNKKGIKMLDLLNSIKSLLVRERKISERQFMALIKFIERERPFKGWSTKQIKDYFGCLIKGYNKESIHEPATLYGLQTN